MELSKIRHVYAKQSISILIFLTVVMVGFMELHPDHQIGNKEFRTTVNSSCCEGVKTIVPVIELHHYHNSFFLTINKVS